MSQLESPNNCQERQVLLSHFPPSKLLAGLWLLCGVFVYHIQNVAIMMQMNQLGFLCE